jgi:dihydroorotate dehydrogenase electron transfer subunit
MKTGEIITNRLLQDEYYRVEFYAPEICRTARAGQFVHVRIPNLEHRILRRPFSICNCTEDGVLTVVYKVVGEGTRALAGLAPGMACELMGPLGNGFMPPKDGEYPVLVVGGYGSAATFMLSQNGGKGGLVLLGARSASDLLLVEEYRRNGFDVRVSTNDGSAGHKGLVTELLTEAIRENGDRPVRFYACGPTGMLYAVAKMLCARNLPGEISLDHLMCCGVGACFACVVKVKDNNADGWRYARSCNEGPVFRAAELYLED